MVTQPAFLPAFLNFCQIGRCGSPFLLTFNPPLLILTPPPQEELAAAESVTIELAEAISIKALFTLLSLYNCNQLVPVPIFLDRYKSVIFKVPILIPSLTIMIIFFAFLFLISSIIVFATLLKGCNKAAPRLISDPFLKNFLLFIFSID